MTTSHLPTATLLGLVLALGACTHAPTLPATSRPTSSTALAASAEAFVTRQVAHGMTLLNGGKTHHPLPRPFTRITKIHAARLGPGLIWRGTRNPDEVLVKATVYRVRVAVERPAGTLSGATDVATYQGTIKVATQPHPHTGATDVVLEVEEGLGGPPVHNVAFAAI